MHQRNSTTAKYNVPLSDASGCRQPTVAIADFLSDRDIRGGLRWAAIGVLWLCVAAAGLGLLFYYENARSTIDQPPSQWPSNATIIPGGGATLLMFAHPHCPCTKASIGEFEKIVTHCQGTVTPLVVFFKPAGSDEGWDQTDLWKTASAIPGVHVVRDDDGKEARCFHATTSGQTLLYNERGELLFEGGITLARGHSGDNPGRDAIESYLVNGSVSRRHTPAFGCPIVTLSASK